MLDQKLRPPNIRQLPPMLMTYCCQNTTTHKPDLWPCLQDDPAEPAPEQSAVLDFHVAPRRYCSPSHPVPIQSSSPLTGMPAGNITGTRHTEGEQINSDHKILYLATVQINPGLGLAPKYTGYTHLWFVSKHTEP